MSAGNVDPVIAAAQARLRVAADLIGRGRDELSAVIAALEEHPDFKRTDRVARTRNRGRALGPALTLVWYLHNSTHSTLHDMELDDAPALLWQDSDLEQLAWSMREFIEDEAETLARRARKGRRVQTSGKRPAAVQAAA